MHPSQKIIPYEPCVNCRKVMVSLVYKKYYHMPMCSACRSQPFRRKYLKFLYTVYKSYQEAKTIY